MDKHADPFDAASAHEMEVTESAVAAARGKVPDPNLRHDQCTECGDEIVPPGRRELGYPTCIYCARKK